MWQTEKEKHFKRNKSRTELSEEKNGQYNTGYTQTRAVLSDKLSVNTRYVMVNHRLSETSNYQICSIK